MEFKTKFNHGDFVYAITYGQKQVKTPCDCCNGESEIFITNHGNIICPKCRGNKYIISWVNDIWHLSEEDRFRFTILYIIVESFDPSYAYNFHQEKLTVKYMAASSGACFYEKDCFATIEEAQQECDRRNKNGN